MIQIEFLQGEDDHLRILFHANKHNNQIVNETKIEGKDVLKLADELFSLLYEINLSESRRVKLFPQFKKQSSTFFSLLFADLLDSGEWEKWGQNITLFFDSKFHYLPVEWAFNEKYFLCEKFIITRNHLRKHQALHREFEAFQPEVFCLAGNFSRDMDIQESVEIELNSLNNIMAPVIDVNGPLYGPFDSKVSINEILDSSDIFHYSGHYKTDENDGWKLNDNQSFNSKDLQEVHNLPGFIFNNVCGKEYSNTNKDFTTALLDSGTRGILSPFGPVKSTSASEFSNLFYSAWKNGITLGEALLEARKYFIEKNGVSDPTWMQYVLYGESKLSIPIQSKTNLFTPVLKILLSLILFFLLSVSIIQFKTWYGNKFESKILYFQQKYSEYDVFISNQTGLEQKLPVKIDVRNKDVFTFSNSGFDTLIIEITLIDSIFTFKSNLPFSQFVIGYTIEDIILLHDDTIMVNLVNNGLCDVQLENFNKEFDIQFGVHNQAGELSWYNINSDFSLFKYDPYFQNDITMKIHSNNGGKFYNYNCDINLCESGIVDISSVWHNKDSCWRFIGF